MNRIEQQMEFIKEVDKLKMIQRQTYLANGVRKENDAEHSWHLAMMCLILKEYANEEVDVLKVMSMVLIHDIIEIDAGDTYAFDDKGYETKREREVEAANRIFSILPEDQALYMRGIWEEFEELNSPEAKFAQALDKIQPMMLNDATNGKSWEEHKVKISQILKRNEKTEEGSKDLWEYALQNYIDKNVKRGKIVDDREGK